MTLRQFSMMLILVSDILKLENGDNSVGKTPVSLSGEQAFNLGKRILQKGL